MKKDILTLLNLDKSDFDRLFDRAAVLKKRRRKGIVETTLSGKTLGLIFDKPSTRTRVSFEAAMAQLGGTSVFLSARDTQIARSEPVRDTARVLSRYIDGIAIRTFSQDLLVEFAQWSDIPVINALTDMFHPCQVLSDLMTVIEYKGGYEGLKIAWIGDGNNVAHSWINASAVLGLHLTLACPPDFEPDARVLAEARKTGRGDIRITHEPEEAASEADVIYTDVWVSMGQENDQSMKKKAFVPYQVNADLVRRARKDVIVMHCLPAHRGEEITEDVMEGPSSVIWDQSENKMHMHKAILEILIGEGDRT